MNKAKKIICVITLMLSAMACAGIASAAGYTPLVRIPGLPATGAVDLSMYMIGLYNFLLSIVGIVAVMMLIFGGMRYITAMGSTSATSSAKDIIINALLGLLLALISWVIVSTINPDVLYIKNPTSELLIVSPVRDVACTISNNPCVCNDGTPLSTSTSKSCSSDCRSGNHCAFVPAVSTKCIAIGASNTGVKDASGVYQCACIDGEVVARGAATTCNDACNAPAPDPNHCGWEYLRVKLAARTDTDNDTGNWEDDAKIFHPDKVPNSELWDFYLTNDGDSVPGFNVTGASYTVGGNTYDCAILETNRDNVGFLILNGLDEHRVLWVKNGIIIGGYYGESLYWDIMKSGQKAGIAAPYFAWCDVVVGAECALDGTGEEDDYIAGPSNTNGWTLVLYAKYGDFYANKCVNESCSFSTVPEYRPSMSIACRNGKWLPTPFKK